MLGAMLPQGIKRSVVLRPYQGEFVEAVVQSWMDGHKKVIAILPTGGGKTTCAGEVIAREIEAGGRVLVMAHTRKLVSQFRASVERDFGIWGEVEAGNTKADKGAPLICATVQSMRNRIAKNKFKQKDFTMVVIDEAHRSLSDGYQEVYSALQDCKWLGITATPRRGDQKDLMNFWDTKAYDVPLSQLIQDGFLAPLTIQNVPVEIKLEHKGSGDFTEDEVAHAITPYFEELADALLKDGAGRCKLVFLPLIPTSKLFNSMLRDRGIRSAHVDGTMSESDINAIIAKLETGELECICCSMLLTEGVDIRPVNFIMNLRPTRSWTLYCQICGRGTRIFGAKEKAQIPGCRWPIKTDCILYDALFQCEQHSLLQRPSCLVSETDEEREFIDAAMASGGGGPKEPKDLLASQIEFRKQREEALKKRLEENAMRKARLVGAMEFFLATGSMDLAEYEPIANWEKDKMTEGQRSALIRNGIDIDSVTCKGHAGRILDVIVKRAEAKQSTLKQAKYAASLGMVDAYTRSFADVSDFISTKKSGDDPLEGIPV